MSEPPFQETDQHRPLEYFHSSEPVPMHPMLLALCTIAGLITGGATTIALGGVCLAVSMDGIDHNRWTARIIGATSILLGIGIFVAEGFKFRRDRSLALERRRRGGRFFLIGFLMGCGLGCLLEGICFSAFGWN